MSDRTDTRIVAELRSFRSLHPCLAIDSAAQSMIDTLSHADAHFDGPALRAAVGGAPATGTRAARPGIVVIPLHGLLMPNESLLTALGFSTSIRAFMRALNAAAADPTIASIVIDCDSGGGSVAMIPEAAQLMREVRAIKPVIVVVGSLCCSAALGIGANATKIYATPSARVGSIGVITQRVSVVEQLKRDGVEVAVIASSAAKAWGHEAVPISADERQYIQRQVDDLSTQLHADVAAGRRVSVETVRRDFGQGRCLTAAQALAVHMIDAVEPSDVSLQRIVQAPAARTALASARTATARAAVASQHAAVTRALLAEPRAALAAARLATQLRSE